MEKILYSLKIQSWEEFESYELQVKFEKNDCENWNRVYFYMNYLLTSSYIDTPLKY